MKNKKRISVFLPSAEGGGAERAMITLANAFAARGYSTDLVLAYKKGPNLKKVSSEVRVIDLCANRIYKSILPFVSYLHKERPDAVLSAMNHANIVAIISKKLSRAQAKLVISERNTISIEAKNIKNILGPLVYKMVKFLYPYSDSIIAVSQAASTDLEKFANLPPGSVKVIYNPFDVDTITSLAEEANDHPWLQTGQPPVVMAAGRLTEQKDFKTLLMAFSLVRDRIGARLIILGEGDQRDQLLSLASELNLASDVLYMPGFKNNPFSFFARASLFVLSSKFEGLPGVLIEAMACGTSVVSTDCPGGSREILADGRWGSLVPVGEPAALAEAIYTSLITPEHERPNSKERASHFAADKAIDSYLAAMGLPRHALLG